MTASTPSVRGTALLRVAGLPVRYWLAGANPGLFAAADRLEADLDRRRAQGARLAELVGERLVPDPGLSRTDRALVLDLRRRLHRGDPLPASSVGRLGEVRPQGELLGRIAELACRDRELEARRDQLDLDVAEERRRLLGVSDEIRAGSAVGSAVLPEDRSTEAASAKARRHRCAHEWQLLERSTTGSTPRGWFSHLAALPVADPAASPALRVGFTTVWTQNVRARRRALADPPADWPEPGTRLALNPLRWDQDDRLVTLVVDQHEETERAVVRRTPLLDEVCAALRGGSRTVAEVVEVLGHGAPDEELVLRGFLRHLVVLGILQVGAAPATVIDRDAVPGPQTRGADPGGGGWVDVYRDVDGSLPARLTARIQDGVGQALRVWSLVEAEPRGAGLVPAADGAWTFSDILASELGGTQPDGVTEPQADRPGRPTSLADLLGWLAEQTEPGADVVLDAGVLDAAGAAPAGPVPWPVDCLCGVPSTGAGYPAVLDEIWPAGILDSRFADALTDLHGAAPQVDEYRALLRRLEELTGLLPVEILAPPLTDGAANAVRRPAYTPAWTGDPHAGAYVRGDPGRYLPLGEIRVRRVDGVLRADVGGRPIWPMYHATRSFSPPWDRIAQILLATAPPWVPRIPRRLLTELSVPPGRTDLPRVTVDGGLVLAPAQWLVAPEELEDVAASAGSAVRGLVRLRSRRSLPRWVWWAPDGDASPVPCDLESLHAVRALERASRSGSTVHLVEMLPAPDELLVVDHAHPGLPTVMSQVQLRLPCHETPAAIAARLAAPIMASHRGDGHDRATSRSPSAGAGAAPP